MIFFICTALLHLEKTSLKIPYISNDIVYYKSILGVLYAGLIVTAKGVQVLEYNCRFGDPETEVLMRLLNSDLYQILLACCEGTLEQTSVQWSSNYACGVVLAASGYPLNYPKGNTITGKWSTNVTE